MLRDVHRNGILCFSLLKSAYDAAKVRQNVIVEIRSAEDSQAQLTAPTLTVRKATVRQVNEKNLSELTRTQQ